MQKIEFSFEQILEIITAFYEKATVDILIGYHFRKILNFDKHLPRIASFWQLQLTGKIDQRTELPFQLLQVHIPLKIKRGEVDRWVTLFEQTLLHFKNQKKIEEVQLTMWMEKVHHFKEKLYILC
jgi:truncated hemoglobin YjbI